MRIKRRDQWGIVPFFFSLILACYAFYLLYQYPSSFYPDLYYKVFPFIGIFLSILSLFTGHFSYPRVHNLKVYLAGYLTGITTLFYFLLFRFPSRMEDGVNILFIIISLNFIIILSLPAYMKYRITKKITFLIITVETLFMLIVRFYPLSALWAHNIIRNSFFGWSACIGFLWFLTIFVITIIKFKDSFFLGGIFSGCSLLYCCAWLSQVPVIINNTIFNTEAESVFFVFTTFFLITGIIVHWFSRMEHRVSYDPLLQIYNRNYCSKIIEEQSNVKTTPPFAIAMVDIDHFKNVNDTYGHQTGDKVLQDVSQTILREVVPDGILCRYGGEELIVFFPGKRTKDIMPVMENVRNSVEKTVIHSGKKRVSVTISIGVSFRESMDQSIINVITTADKALYRAKKSGRNQIKSGKTADN